MPGGPYFEPPRFCDNDNGELNESEARRPGGRDELLLADERRRRSSGIGDEEGGVGMGDKEEDVSVLKRPHRYLCTTNLDARS